MYDDFYAIFSESRLATYLKAANQDKQQALDLYKLNLRLSEALYPLLCLLEITLRNRISSVLIRYYGNNWFDGHQGKWFDGQNLPLPAGKNYELDEIQRTKNKCLKRGKQITSDILTADLNFGFWTEMMTGRYEKTLWQKYISEVFPDAPRKYNLVRNLRSHRQELNRIRNLRNRVFHHEPVFSTKSLSFYELLADYNNAKKLIGWLSQDALRLLEEYDRFDSLVILIPPSMKSPPLQPQPKKNPGRGSSSNST